MATDLYERTINFDYGDQERKDLMRKVWVTTPWMVDVFTGGYETTRSREMTEWCRDTFGPECWPIHGKPGKWQRGGATIYGWTWFGFSAREDMERFTERWPNPSDDGQSTKGTT